MAKEIKLTKRANAKLSQIAQYIEDNFGLSTAETFSNRVIDFFEVLSNYPQIGTCTDSKKQIFGFVLSKHTTIFYRLTKTEIIVLNLFDNRTNPKTPKF